MNAKPTFETLIDRYGPRVDSQEERVHDTFDTSSSDREAYKAGARNLQRRVSSSPGETKQDEQLSEIYGRMAELEFNMGSLADSRGKLEVQFKDLLSKDGVRIYETAALAFYKAVGREYGIRARKIRIKVAERKGKGLGGIISGISDAMEDQHEEVTSGVNLTRNTFAHGVAYVKQFDSDLIEALRGGYVGSEESTIANNELDRLTSELDDINDVLTGLERQAIQAKSIGDMDSLHQYTDEMDQILIMRNDVLDGQTSAEGVVSEIRRKMLESTETVQSARGAGAAMRVNNAHSADLIDSFVKLEIKYRNAKRFMIPVFEQSAANAAAAKQGLGLTQFLSETSENANRLLDLAGEMTLKLSSDSFELFKNPTYDNERMEAALAKSRENRANLRQLEDEWMALENAVTPEKVTEIMKQDKETAKQGLEQPHYAQQQ
jgi:hypothetical protein